MNVSPHPFTTHLLEPESHRKLVTTPKIILPCPPIEDSYSQIFPGSAPDTGACEIKKEWLELLSFLVQSPQHFNEARIKGQFSFNSREIIDEGKIKSILQKGIFHRYFFWG